MYFETKYPLQLQYFLRPTEVQKNGAEGVFLVFLVLADFVFHFMLYQTKFCEKTIKTALLQLFRWSGNEGMQSKWTQIWYEILDQQQDQKSIDATLEDKKHIWYKTRPKVYRCNSKRH